MSVGRGAGWGTPDTGRDNGESWAEAEWRSEHPPEWWGMVELLEQDEWWRARDEGWIRVRDMSESHRRNLARWLKRREFAISRAVFDSLTHGLDGDKHWHDEIIDGVIDETCRPDWLETRPLYKALVA